MRQILTMKTALEPILR